MTKTPINNKLLNKAILVIGNDTAVIKTLIIDLAQRGADVALICWQMQLDSVLKVVESVQAAGKRFLLIEQAKTEDFSDKQVIDAITAEFGELHAVIDFSGKTEPMQANKQSVTPWLIKPSWTVSKAILTALVQP